MKNYLFKPTKQQTPKECIIGEVLMATFYTAVFLGIIIFFGSK